MQEPAKTKKTAPIFYFYIVFGTEMPQGTILFFEAQ
jgi:hypothetical protein